MAKLSFSGFFGTALLISTASAFAASPVKSVELETKIKTKSQVPVIVVGSNGNRYTHIKNSQMRVPIRFTASCRGKHTLARTQIAVGTFSITGGHMRSNQKLAMQEIPAAAKTSHLPWKSHTFTVSMSNLGFDDSMNPVSACNSFLNAKVSKGMRRQFFMQKDRRMTVTFPISLAAECKAKWKQDGRWRQTSRPIQALVICKGRR